MIKVNISQIKTNKVFEFRYDFEADDFCLKKSIETYGQLRPIIVDSDMEIIDGYKLFSFLKEMSYSEVMIKEIKYEDYNSTRLELNSFKKQIDPIPFYTKLRDIDREKANLPFKKETLDGWVELLSWDWNIYKSKTSDSILW